jgi:hypothetical protein
MNRGIFILKIMKNFKYLILITIGLVGLQMGFTIVALFKFNSAVIDFAFSAWSDSLPLSFWKTQVPSIVNFLAIELLIGGLLFSILMAIYLSKNITTKLEKTN